MGKASRNKKREILKEDLIEVRSEKSVLKGWMVLLSVSVVLGYSYNSFNPSGIEKTSASPVPSGEKGTSRQSEAASVPPYVHEGEHNADGFPVVTWAQVQDLSLNYGALLVDARPQWAFDAGHLPNAVCLPSSVEMTPAYNQFATEHPRDRHIVVYCSDLACGRSRDLAVQLKEEFGFTSLLLFEAGYKDYLAQQQ